MHTKPTIGPTGRRSTLRDRHVPRVCGHCHSPLARQEDECWRCGTQWASEDEPRTALRVIDEGASLDRVEQAA